MPHHQTIGKPTAKPAGKAKAGGRLRLPFDRKKPPLRLEWISAGSLAANPANWRRHPPEQVAALKAMLHDPRVGWAGACLYNERTKRLIDGHARRDAVTPDTPVPVLVGSWSPADEKRILVTLDPLGGMAATNYEALQALLDEAPLDDPALAGLAEHLEAELADAELQPGDDGEAPDADESGGGGEGDDSKARRAGEAQYQVLVFCKDEADQQVVFTRLKREGRKLRVLTVFA